MSASKIPQKRLLLVSMPLTHPQLPNLAIEQLAAAARAQGQVCDVLHGTLLLPRRFPAALVSALPGPAMFTPAYFGLDAAGMAEEVADEVVRCLRLSGAPGKERREELVTDYLIAMDDAETCLAECLDAIPAGRYDVVGLSVGFDAQKMPSAALARRLKQREPALRVLVGGTGCDGEMGPAMLERFPEFDGLLRGEADETFLMAVSALRGETSPAVVPNFVYRDDGRIHVSDAAFRVPPMDDVPIPDYTSFLTQRTRSSYNGDKVVLLFETSRGCWWGDRCQCRFCGIAAIGDAPYRSRQPESALNLISTLEEKHRPEVLYATDAVLDPSYVDTVFPVLAGQRRRASEGKPELFYEVKTPLGRHAVASLAAAGVRRIQPGIETLSSRLLRALQKGASAVQQIELLKWVQTCGMDAAYGLIVEIPGETADDYVQMLHVLPRLHHLPPPTALNPLALHKFSPYAREPARYGICNVRPFNFQRIIYRADDELLARLCYELDYSLSSKEEPALTSARAAFHAAVEVWRAAYFAGQCMVMSDLAGEILITRRDARGGVELHRWHGLDCEVIRACAEATSLERVAKQLTVSPREVSESADRLTASGVLLQMDGRYLTLAIPPREEVLHSVRTAPETRSEQPIFVMHREEVRSCHS